MAEQTRHVIFVIGPSGCGKSTLAAALAERLEAAFLEGDAYHPPENRARMQRGEPLDDAARLPWLHTLGAAAQQSEAPRTVVACSALKRRYRDILRQHCPGARFLLLNIDKDKVAARLAQRQGHFMPASLLDSQLRDFEPPHPQETDVTALDAAGTPADLLQAALSHLQP